MATPIGQMPLREKGQKTCLEHKGKQLDLYCKECDRLVCLKCLSTSHNRHDMCELSDITPEKKQDIQNLIDNAEQNDLAQVRTYIKSTDTLLKDNRSYFETLSRKLKMQTEKLKNDLDTLTAQTLSLYHKMEQENITLIQKYKQDLQMYERELAQQVTEYKAVLQQGSHIDIYAAGCGINFQTQISLPVKPVLGTASFSPNTNPQHLLELAFGKIDGVDQGQTFTYQDRSVQTFGDQEPSSKLQESEPKQNKATYMLDLPQTNVLEEWESPARIYSICPTIDGQVWSTYSHTLTLLDRKGKIIQEVKHNTGIIDISLSPSTQNLWVCNDIYNILELVHTVSGQLTRRFRTKEKPQCICVTASNNVIVGMAKHITKFTTQGRKVLSTSVPWFGKPLVCSPGRISECPVTHNVAVIDGNYQVDGGDGIPHIIVMNSDFKELFVYRGDIPSTYKQTSHKAARPFNPYGVVYDSVGNIVIGDSNNNRILLISGGGEFLRIIRRDTYTPWTIGVDCEDVLWAVFSTWPRYNVKLLQYSNL